MREFQISETACYDMEKDHLVIHLPPEIDDHVCKRIYSEMEQLLLHRKIKRLLFDFSGVQFMDSSGVGLLLNCYRRMRQCGGIVAVYGVDRRMNRLLSISGIYQVIESIS